MFLGHPIRLPQIQSSGWIALVWWALRPSLGREALGRHPCRGCGLNNPFPGVAEPGDCWQDCHCWFELVVVHVFLAYNFSSASFYRTFPGYQFHFWEFSLSQSLWVLRPARPSRKTLGRPTYLHCSWSQLLMETNGLFPAPMIHLSLTVWIYTVPEFR